MKKIPWFLSPKNDYGWANFMMTMIVVFIIVYFGLVVAFPSVFQPVR